MTPDEVDALIVPLEEELAARRAEANETSAAMTAIRSKITSADTAVKSLRTKLLAIDSPIVTPPPPIVTPPPVVVPPVTAPPLLTADRLKHVGYFRLPRDGSNGRSFEYGGGPIAYDRAEHTLFVGSLNGRAVAEVSIPSVTGGAFATYVQGFQDPTEGKVIQALGPNPMNEDTLPGLLVVGSQLIGTASIYYDSDNHQRRSHYRRSRLLSPSGQVTDFVGAWRADRTGYVAGYLAHVPPEWQARLKGSIVTGQFGIPIIGRASFGPSAFALAPAFTAWPLELLPATPLVYYTGDHPTIGGWNEDSTLTFGPTTIGGGLALIDGTATALFFGRTGIGPYGYGKGTADPTLHGQVDPTDQGTWVYDPVNPYKGTHAYPYRYQIWAYDLNDWAAVAAGTKQPWEIVPYGVWPLVLPTPEASFRGIGGVDYNPALRHLYVSQLSADEDGYAHRAYIHVIEITI